MPLTLGTVINHHTGVTLPSGPEVVSILVGEILNDRRIRAVTSYNRVVETMDKDQSVAGSLKVKEPCTHPACQGVAIARAEGMKVCFAHLPKLAMPIEFLATPSLAPASNSEISLTTCPLCRTPVYSCTRCNKCSIEWKVCLTRGTIEDGKALVDAQTQYFRQRDKKQVVLGRRAEMSLRHGGFSTPPETTISDDWGITTMVLISHAQLEDDPEVLDSSLDLSPGKCWLSRRTSRYVTVERLYEDAAVVGPPIPMVSFSLTNKHSQTLTTTDRNQMPVKWFLETHVPSGTTPPVYDPETIVKEKTTGRYYVVTSMPDPSTVTMKPLYNNASFNIPPVSLGSWLIGLDFDVVVPIPDMELLSNLEDVELAPFLPEEEAGLDGFDVEIVPHLTPTIDVQVGDVWGTVNRSDDSHGLFDEGPYVVIGRNRPWKYANSWEMVDASGRIRYLHLDTQSDDMSLSEILKGGYRMISRPASAWDLANDSDFT